MHQFLDGWRFWLRMISNLKSPEETLEESVMSTLSLDMGGQVTETTCPRAVITLALPFLPSPLHLRAGTSDVNSFLEVFALGAYNFPESLGHSCRQVVDVGANAGLTTVFFANRYPLARILAIEPDKENVQIIRRNVSSYPHVEVLEAGLWGSTCRLRIANPDAEPWAFQTAEAGSAEEGIRGLSMWEILEYLNHQRVNLLKMDIEGAERNVLGSANSGWLRFVDVLAIELHEQFAPGCRSVVDQTLKAYQFSRHTIGNTEFFVFNHFH